MVAALSSAVPPEDGPEGYDPEPRCAVCGGTAKRLPRAHAVRDLTDGLLAQGLEYAAVERLLRPHVEDWPEESRPSYQSIRRHARRHLQWDRKLVRQIVERRSKGSGTGPWVSAAMLAEAIQNLGFMAIARGDLQPTVKEALQASQFLREIEREESEGQSNAHMLAELNVIMNTLRDLMTPEQFAELKRRLMAFKRGESPLPPLGPDPMPGILAKES